MNQISVKQNGGVWMRVAALSSSCLLCVLLLGEGMPSRSSYDGQDAEGGAPVWVPPDFAEWQEASARRLSEIVASGVPSGDSLADLSKWNEEEWDREAAKSKEKPPFPKLMTASFMLDLPNFGRKAHGGDWGEQVTLAVFVGAPGEAVVRVFLIDDRMIAIAVSAIIPEFLERWVVFDGEALAQYFQDAGRTVPTDRWLEREGNHRWW